MPDGNDQYQNPFAPEPPRRAVSPLDALSLELERRYPTQGNVFIRVPRGVAGLAPIPGGQAALMAIQEAVFGKALPMGVPEAVGTPPPTARPIDVTDPSVDPGDLELTPDEKMVRRFRRVGRQIHGALTGGLLPAGLEQNVKLGQVMPAQDWQDKVIDFLAPMLATAGVFSAAGAVSGGVGLAEGAFAGAGEAGAEAAGMAEGVAPGATAIGRFLTTPIEGALGRVAPRAFTSAVARLAPRALTQASAQAGVGGLLEDLGFGAAYGAGELGAQQAMGAISPEDADKNRLKFVTETALAGMALGGLLRGVFHPLTTIEMARSVFGRTAATDIGAPLPTPIGIQIGDEVAGHTATTETEGGAFRWRKGGKFSKGPSETEIRDFLVQKAQQASSGEQPSPTQVKETLASIDPDKPATMPQDLQAKMSDIGIIAAQYYIDRVPKIFKELETPQILTQIEALKTVALDPSVPLPERVTATARFVALEHATKTSQGTLPGMLPFEMERAAVAMVKKVKPAFGTDGVIKAAADVAIDGQPELAQRMKQLALMEDWPEKYHAEVQKRLNVYSKTKSGGFKSGDMAIWNGRIVRVADKPEYGMTHVLIQGKNPGNAPVLADVTELTHVPKVGEAVRLKDGRVIKVTAMRPDTFQFKSERWYDLTDIDRVGSSKEDLAGEARAAEVTATKDPVDTAVNIPPTQAAMKSGEPVTVTAIGDKEVTVKTKSGRTQKVPRTEVVEASTTARPEAPVTQVPVPSDAEVKSMATTLWNAVKKGKNLTTVSTDPMTTAMEQARVDGALASKKHVDTFIRMWYASRNNETIGHVTTMVPGTVPEGGKRLVFLPVKSSAAAAFEAGVEAGNVTADMTLGGMGNVVRPHVLPPYPHNPDITMYGVEVPSALLPKENYSDLANGAIKALQGEGRIEHYLSPIDMDVGVLNKQANVFKISTELHTSTQWPEHLLADAGQAEQTAYLRHLIAFNEKMDTEVMTPIRSAAVALDDVAAAVRTGDGPDALEASQTASQAHTEALAAASDVSIREGGNTIEDLMTDLSSDPNVSTSQQLQREGLTPATLDTWTKMLKNMDISNNMVDREILVLSNKDNPEMRLFVRKLVEPGAARTAQGIQPVMQVVYDAVPVTREGVVLKAARARFYSPEDLTAAMDQQGFVPSVTKLATMEYGHPRKPSLVASIHPTPQARIRAILEERNLNFPETAIGEGGKVPAAQEKFTAEGVSAEVKQIIAKIGQTYKHDESGMRGIHQLAEETFDTIEEAEAWLRKKGMTSRERPVDYVFASDFSKLPPTDQLSTIPEEALDKIHEMLTLNMQMILRIQRRQVPDAVVEYATEFGKIFYKRTGQKPFTRDLRLNTLALPHVDDIGPKAQSFSRTLTSKEDMAVVADATDPIALQPGDAPVEEMGPQMHLGNKQPGRLPPDYTELYTQLLGHDEAPQNDILTAAKKVDDALKQQTEWTDAHAITEANAVVASPETVQFSPSRVAVARYTPTGQVVEIVKVPLTGDEVTVRFPGEGEINISRKDLQLPGATRPSGEPARTPEGLAGGEIASLRDRYMTADWVASGRYVEAFKREPPVGLGAVEKELGIFGADRDTVEAAMAARADEIAQNLRVTKGGMLTGSPKDISQLLRIYARSLWLDQVLETRPGKPFYGKGVFVRAQPTLEVTKAIKVSDHIVRAIETVDKKLVKPFRLAVYHTIKEQLGNTPLAELQARATAGFGISPEVEGILRGWGKEIGVAESTPLPRIVSELVAKHVYDPNGAKLMVYLNNDAGFLRLSKNIEDYPIESLRIKVPRVNDIWTEFNLSVPWKLMRRHPLTRLVSDLIYRAREEQLIEQRAVRELHVIIRNKYHNYSDFKFIKNLKEQYNTWADAEAAGVDPKWRWGYERVAEFLDDRRGDLIRHLLRRQVTPIAFDPSKPGMHELAVELGLDPATLRNGALLLPKHPELVREFAQLGVEGERPNNYWTHDRIEQFMQLLHNNKSAADLPPEVPAEMARVFDRWKIWGRNNYWPLIHEGNLAIKVPGAGGTEEVVGFAQSLPDALEALEQLKKDGRISPAEFGRASIEETKKKVFDDIIVRAVRSKSEFNSVIEAATEQMKFSPEDIQAMIVSAETPKEFIPIPGQVHVKPRVANLKPIFDDPMKELAVYSARISRMNYYWKVVEAFRMMQDGALDASLSSAYQTPRLGEMQNLTRYMKEFIARALGQRGAIERNTDVALGLANYVFSASRTAAKKLLGGEANIPWADVLNPKYYVQRYGARKAADAALAFQSVYRLGGSVGSAFANATQYWVNTLPKLMEAGDNPLEMAKLALTSYKTAARLWRYRQFGEKFLIGAKLSPEEVRLNNMIDRAGIGMAPSKLAAGAGFGFGDLEGGVPIYKGKPLEHAWNWTEYLGMFAFNGAERTNRFGTAVAAMDKALRKGMSEEDAISYARKLVRETQFSYDELSIPSAMAKLGPLGRVLFQFKPFLLNQLSYEKDLVMGLAGLNPSLPPLTAAKQFAVHLGALGVFGGLVGTLYNPAVALLGGTVRMVTGHDVLTIAGHQFPLTAKAAEEIQRENRATNGTLEEQFMRSVHYQGDDLLYYGVPGLLHLSLGQRVGVSGQDVLNAFDQMGNIAGPTVSMYADLWKAWAGYLRQATPEERFRFYGGQALGLAASALLPGGLSASVPARLASSLVGGNLASLGTHNSFQDFLQGKEGRTLMMKDFPTLWRNFQRSMLVSSDGIFLDIDGKPQHVPVAEQNEAAIYSFLGLPTIRNTEYAAAESILLSNADDAALQRKTMTDEIARAWVKRDYTAAYDAIFRAQSAGISISESAIQRRIQALSDERIETLMKRVPLSERIITGQTEEE